MKNLTPLLMICLFFQFSCQNGENSTADTIQTMDEDELRRVSNLIDPAPKTYQEDQVNKLVEYALDQDWPVHQSASGLLYWVREEGNDVRASKGDVVLVRYKGNLLDGKIFDQSPASGEPVQFNVGSVIPAWQEAMSMIGEEGKITILAHSDLGYRGRRIGNAIPPYSPLIFEIELLHINQR